MRLRLLTYISVFIISVFWGQIAYASFDAIGAAIDTANNMVADVGATIETTTSKINSLITEKVGDSIDINLDIKKNKKLKKTKERLEKWQKRYQKLQAAAQKTNAIKEYKDKRLATLNEKIAATSQEYEARLAEFMQAKEEGEKIVCDVTEQINTAKEKMDETKTQIDEIKKTTEDITQTVDESMEQVNKTSTISDSQYGYTPTISAVSAIQTEAYQQQTTIPNETLVNMANPQFMINEVSVDDVEQLVEVSDSQIVETPLEFADINIEEQIKLLNRPQAKDYKTITSSSKMLVDTAPQPDSSRSAFIKAEGVTDKLFDEAMEIQKNTENNFNISNKEKKDE